MNDTSKEVIGFLSRWCLLAIAAGAVAVFVWTAAIAASDAAAGAEARLVLSDAIWRDRQSMHAVGYLLPPGPAGTVTEFIATEPGQKPRLVYGRRGQVRTTVRGAFTHRPYAAEGATPIETPYPVRLKGLPYGSYAFRAAEAICVVARASRPVFAVDVRLVTDPHIVVEGTVHGCVRQLQDCGQVAMFYVGRPDDRSCELAEGYAQLRRQIRADWPNMPVVLAIRPRYGMLASLRHMAWTTTHRGGARPVVITPRPDLARAAATEGFTTHLIFPRRLHGVEMSNLIHHLSLSEFGKWLAENPRPAARQ